MGTRTRSWWLVLALTLLCASSLPAQGSPLYTFDRWRESQEWLPASLDDRDWKTWGWHGAFTLGGGSLIGALTPLSHRQGRHVMAVFYVVRELYGIVFDGNRKWLDASLDAAVPVVVARIRF